jgi:hypothetical protein
MSCVSIPLTPFNRQNDPRQTPQGGLPSRAGRGHRLITGDGPRIALRLPEGEASLFFIESKISFQERGQRALKSGYTFALSNRRGDIVSGLGHADAIYFNDTRDSSCG